MKVENAYKLKTGEMIKKYRLLACFSLFSLGVKAQLTPLVIGKIPANDSLVVIYDVTINHNLPAGTSYIENQGSLTGANITALVTDDPRTAMLNDPTRTLLNMFPLPVSFVSFKAYERNSYIRLEWSIAQQVNVHKYEVERSADGISFTRIGEVLAMGDRADYTYTFDDVQPLTAKGYYRIKSVDADGKRQYTNVLRLDRNVRPFVNIYPNPVPDKRLILQFANMEKGTYTLELYNQAGQNVFKKSLPYAGGSMTEQVSLPIQIKGVCLLVLKNSSAISFSQMVLIE